jgi:DnaK suppressor protein
LNDLLHNTGISGDSADLAFDSAGDQVTSQLAELESRELMQIERAIQRLKHGTYGLCELCQKKIPISRLNALPFSTTCIHCQREMESGGGYGGRSSADWERASDMEARMVEPRDVDLSQLEMDYTK